MKRWTVVLISPKEGGNVGAAARVLKNFGAGALRVVDPRCEPNGEEARRFSSGAAELLRACKPFPDLRSALADMELSIGLTGVSGKHHKLDITGLVPADALAAKMHLTKCALVFGREESGMLSEELETCDFLWSLPTNAGFPSLNLAQAIGVTLAGVAEAERQISQRSLGRGLAKTERSLNPLGGSHDRADRPATQEDLNHLGDHLATLMERIKWDEGRRRIGSIVKLRNLLVRGSVTHREVSLLHGLCRRSLHHLGEPDNQ